MQLDVIILSEISQTEKDRFQGVYMLGAAIMDVRVDVPPKTENRVSI